MFENIETLQIISTIAIAFAVAMLFFFLWNRREERRTRAIDVAAILHEWGLDLLAKLFTAYAIGNYIGGDSVGRTIREIIEEIKGGGLPTMLRKVGWKVVEGVFIKNEDDRAKLTELLAQSKSNNELQPPTPTLR